MIVWIPLLVLALVFTTKRKNGSGRRVDLGFVIVILILAWLAWSSQVYL
ncbi:hypothetical protein TFLX_06286 [Thermoflexales bacterium]|jgi:hypothetical protein|nr:hypothetical protein TFLX_06286 [Thermoflexales bacterium]